MERGRGGTYVRLDEALCLAGKGTLFFFEVVEIETDLFIYFRRDAFLLFLVEHLASSCLHQDDYALSAKAVHGDLVPALLFQGGTSLLLLKTWKASFTVLLIWDFLTV